jgi:hypothetical protein
MRRRRVCRGGNNSARGDSYRPCAAARHLSHQSEASANRAEPMLSSSVSFPACAARAARGGPGCRSSGKAANPLPVAGWRSSATSQSHRPHSPSMMITSWRCAPPPTSTWHRNLERRRRLLAAPLLSTKVAICTQLRSVDETDGSGLARHIDGPQVAEWPRIDSQMQ